MAIIRMTREEYEKKYGMKPPVFAGASFDSSSIETPPDRNIGQKAAGFLGIEKFGKGIAAGLDNTTQKTVSQIGQQEAKGQQDLTNKIRMEKDPVKKQRLVDFMKRQYGGDSHVPTATDINPDLGLSNREVIGSAANTAMLFAPGASKGASLGKKVLAGAATGYGLDVGSKLQTPEKSLGEAFTPGTGTVVGAVLPILGAIVGKVSPKKLEEINLRMTPVEKQNMQKKGKDIAGYLAKQKLTGTPQTRYQKIEQLYDDMEQKVSKAVKDAGYKIKKKELIEAVQQIPEKFSDDIGGYEEATKASEKIVAFLQKKAPKEISGELLNSYKRNLFKRAYSKNNTDVLNESYHAVASYFKGLLDNNVSTLRPLNQEYGNIIDARKILFKATTRPELGLVGKLMSGAAGAGIGGALGGPVGAGVGAVVGEKGAQEIFGTATRSTIGAGLQNIDDLINKIPIDKSGNVQLSKKALIRLIQQIFGYE